MKRITLPTTATCASHMARPDGFTLAEVLLAIVLFAVGILALASTSTFIAAQATDARAFLEGAQGAGGTLDSLRSVPCRSLASGSASFPGGTLAWTATSATQSRAVRLTLTMSGHRGTRSFDLDALMPCEQ